MADDPEVVGRSSWNRSSLIGGIAQVALGSGFLIGSLNLSIGSASRMGPGFFPMILSIVFIALGLATVATAAPARRRYTGPEYTGPIARRPAICVFAAIVVFGLALERVGFLPAVALTVLIARFGEPGGGWKGTVGLLVAMLFINWLVFIFLLGMPIRLFVAPF